MTRLHSVRNQGSVNFLRSHSFLTVRIYGPIHKAAVQHSAGGWKDPQRPFPIYSLRAFSGIVPGKAENGSSHKAASLTVHGRSTGFPCIIPKIFKEAAVQNALGCACFPEFLKKFSEHQIL